MILEEVQVRMKQGRRRQRQPLLLLPSERETNDGLANIIVVDVYTNHIYNPLDWIALDSL